MNVVEKHSHQPDVTFNGGDLNCGNGLLLLIRQHIDPMERGGLLEVQSVESSVQEDLPAWCRLTGNQLLSTVQQGQGWSFLVCKGALSERSSRGERAPQVSAARQPLKEVTIPATLPQPSPAPAIAPFSVMGIGSWPRPAWLLRALHERLEGRLPEADFQATADDAVRLCVEAQLRAGVDVVTDGEQRRDNYSSFVGGLLDNCQLIPLTDLLPLVDDPEKLRKEMASLDVPAEKVRHPAVFGKLGRSRPLAVHELEFVRRITDRPVKVALPGPYLLTRTMWLECVSDKAYASREELAQDIVRVLREEVHYLLAAGAALVQLDEPVLSEVVFTGAKNTRSFMCGALSERGDADVELEFATRLVNEVVAGLPRERLGLHMCRGNWTRDEGVALRGDYRPLLPVFRAVQVGTLFLEYCTPRAGDLEVLKELPSNVRVGLGVVNQKLDRIESKEEVLSVARRAREFLGGDRLLLVPDCGFATFADNPIASAAVATEKLRVMSAAAAELRREGR
jgi:5-methyltetrahydropteroyltriglutamate--homocysteine methyltransferase